MTDVQDSLVGVLLGDQFLIESRLGEGGMGALYRARQVSVDRPVAIKVVHTRLAETRPEVIERFKFEARALAQLNHPNIVQLYTLGQSRADQWFLAMELVSGRSLAQQLRDGPLAPRTAVEIARQVASALGAAHARQLIHRDLKPDNIMLSEQSTLVAKVVDFGIAKSLNAQSEHLTSTGEVFGTPRYLAPEQIRSQAVDGRADVYALGLVLYEMLAGDVPFHGETAYDVMLRQVSEVPEAPSRHRSGLSPALDAIVLKCLEKEPARRFASAAALESALKHWLEADERGAAPTPRAAERSAEPDVDTQEPDPDAGDNEADRASEPPTRAPRRGMRPVHALGRTLRMWGLPLAMALTINWFARGGSIDGLRGWWANSDFGRDVGAWLGWVQVPTGQPSASAPASGRERELLTRVAQYCLNVLGGRAYADYGQLVERARQGLPDAPRSDMIDVEDAERCLAYIAAARSDTGAVATTARAYAQALKQLLEPSRGAWVERFRALIEADRALRPIVQDGARAREAARLRDLPADRRYDRAIYAVCAALRELVQRLNRPASQLGLLPLDELQSRSGALANALVQLKAVLPAPSNGERKRAELVVSSGESVLAAVSNCERVLAEPATTPRARVRRDEHLSSRSVELRISAGTLVSMLNASEPMRSARLVELLPVWTEAVR